MWRFMEPLFDSPRDVVDAIRISVEVDSQLWLGHPEWVNQTLKVSAITDFGEMVNVFDSSFSRVAIPEILGAFWNPRVMSREWDLSLMGAHETVFGVAAYNLPVADVVLPILVNYGGGVFSNRVALRCFSVPDSILEGLVILASGWGGRFMIRWLRSVRICHWL